jgi:hypothetical protein
MTAPQHKLKTGFFARHETFCPRYGWLKKGYDGVAGYPELAGMEPKSGDPQIFDRDDAIEILGVGKNMVRSIRFWCLTFHVIALQKAPKISKISGPMQPSWLGKKLLSEDGWDPYLEDPSSLWLLHWNLFVPPIVAPAWSLAINHSLAESFSIKDLTRKFIEYTADIPEFSRLSASSFEKDASCFIRMYAPLRDGKSDEIECLFTHLGFLKPAETRGYYRFHLAEKPDLPDEVFLAACFEFAHHYGVGSKSLALNTIAYEWNSPGRVFQLSETDIGNRLEHAASRMDDVVFTESYGNRQLQFEADPIKLRNAVLERYYSGRTFR